MILIQTLEELSVISAFCNWYVLRAEHVENKASFKY